MAKYCWIPCRFLLDNWACILESFFLSVFPVSRPRVVDVEAEVVDALAFLQTDEEGQEEADELFLDYEFRRDLRLVGTHLGDRLAHLPRRGAGGECGDVGWQLPLLFYIEGEAVFVIRKSRAGQLCRGRFFGLSLHVVEMLLRLDGIRQDLVRASVDVYVDA